MQNNASESKETTKADLKSQLKWGDIKRIATIAGVSRATVQRYFDEDKENSLIKKAAETLLNVRESEMIENAKNLA